MNRLRYATEDTEPDHFGRCYLCREITSLADEQDRWVCTQCDLERCPHCTKFYDDGFENRRCIDCHGLKEEPNADD